MHLRLCQLASDYAGQLDAWPCTHVAVHDNEHVVLQCAAMMQWGLHSPTYQVLVGPMFKARIPCLPILKSLAAGHPDD